MTSDDFLLPFRDQTQIKPISNIALTIVMIISLIYIALSDQLLGILTIYVICFVFYLSFRAQFFKTLNIVGTAYIVIFFIGVSSLFLKQGDVLASFLIGNRRIYFYEVAVFRAIYIWIRGLFSVSIITLYTTTITVQEFIQSLRSIFIPNILVTFILLILRYTPMLYQQGLEIRTAQELRGLKNTSFNRRFTAAASRIGGTLIRSIRKGTEVYEAMILRGLENSDLVKRSNVKWLDFIIVPIFIIIFTFIIGGFYEWII
ncbi:MAG: energy-coupling factor transporter transmembrane protein EcfT [Asgard group archaeon]|nr:energy-coupling factor transporter transmembrane protein EcfT [Asgard group archaeon]